MPKIHVRPPHTVLAFSLTLALAATFAHAQQTPVQAPATQQREHHVRLGDTLWDLARTYLNNPWAWPLIFEANRGVVENPHWIYPAEVLIIPGLVPPAAPLGEPERAAPVYVDTTPLMPTEPPPPQRTAVNLDLRRPVVPVAEYMAAPWIQMGPQRDVVARIIRLADPFADSDKLPASLHPNVRVHLGDLSGSRQVGDSLVIVRFTRRVGEWGELVEPLGVLRVDSVTPTVVSAKLVRQFGTARVGDRVMVMGTTPEIGLGRATPVSDGLHAELLEFVANEPLHGTTDLGFVSVGNASGIAIGDEFEVYVAQRLLDDERAEILPSAAIATVRVIRVGERTSTVRVLSVNSAALRDGLPVRLIRKMN